MATSSGVCSPNQSANANIASAHSFIKGWPAGESSVALHWSVPFAKEIDQETGELVERAEAFDQAVVKAFKVPTKRHELRLTRKPLSDRIYADLEQRIQQISGLAYKLGNRLRRVAVWASEGHTLTTGNGQQSGREKTGGLEAQLRTEAVAKGIGTIAPRFANRGNGETGPAPINAIHSYLSASTKDQDDSLIAGYARATAGDLLAACNRMIQCLAGFDTVFLMSPKGASAQASQIDDEWFKGFNRTHETLCLAASARKMDVAPTKRATAIAGTIRLANAASEQQT